LPIKRLAKPFYKIFCKTILQIVLPIKRLAKPFYRSADYAGRQYKKNRGADMMSLTSFRGIVKD